MQLLLFAAVGLLLSTCGAAAVAAAAAAAPPALVPWPTNCTLLPDEAGVSLTAASKIVYASAELAGPAAVLAEDLAVLTGLTLATSAGTESRAGDVLLVLGPPPAPPPPPPPLPPPAPPPPPPVCTTTAKTKLNATNWADPNGPRTAADAAACCALCAALDGCASWSFQVDPKVPGKVCHWATLTYCCWMHGAGNGEPLPDPDYTSGTVPATPDPVMPADLPAVTAPGFPSSAYTLTAHAASGVVITAGTTQGVLSGTATLLQSIHTASSSSSNGGGSSGSRGSSSGAVVSVPTMSVDDRPFREWRGLQLDLHGTPYHSIALLKQYIQLARYYKLNVLTFNLGPSLWLSPAMPSTEKVRKTASVFTSVLVSLRTPSVCQDRLRTDKTGIKKRLERVSAQMNASWKARAPLHACYDGFCDFYSESDMRELIHYGASRGVRLVPSTVQMPF
jgi:hypothetical protein